MKKYTTSVAVLLLSSLLLCGGCTVALYSSAASLFWLPLAVWLFLLLASIVVLLRFRWACTEWMHTISNTISPQNRRSLDAFPMPLLLMNDAGAVLYTNDLFNTMVMDGGVPVADTPIGDIFHNVSALDIVSVDAINLCRDNRRYTAHVSKVQGETTAEYYLLYLNDDTALKDVADEYAASRPVVMQICIDNLAEATNHLRSGDRSRIAGVVETMLEDWITADGGVLQKYDNDRFIAITEHRYLAQMEEDGFPILSRIRQAFPEVEGNITISIGVAEGESVEVCRQTARRALYTALGRGGDQVVVQPNANEEPRYYGGHSDGVERQSRVQARLMAADLLRYIKDSDRVLVMGHRYSDLDCLGSGVALVSVARELQKPAVVVLDRSATMAGQLVQMYEDAGKGDWFVSPAAAEKMMTPKTLLIVVDTNLRQRTESPELYDMAERVVVIDHHRLGKGYIDDMLLAHYNPNASSASEMVAEMMPYLSTRPCARMEAEALLAGIMLDTRSFVILTGVSTFETAAYLRGLGADTVTVKKLFQEDLDIYQMKSSLMKNAQVYRDTAIAVADGNISNARVVVAQTADDLLLVHGVKASFVLSSVQGSVHISARSYGEYNVEVIMLALQGGGHRTMAGTQIENVTIEEGIALLKQAIDRYIEKNV